MAKTKRVKKKKNLPKLFQETKIRQNFLIWKLLNLNNQKNRKSLKKNPRWRESCFNKFTPI